MGHSKLEIPPKQILGYWRLLQPQLRKDSWTRFTRSRPGSGRIDSGSRKVQVQCILPQTLTALETTWAVDPDTLPGLKDKQAQSG